MERRNTDKDIHATIPEVRQEGSVLSGYAAVFYDGKRSSEYEIFPGLVERIAPGAFRDALRTSDVRALFDHDSKQLLGTNRAGTLHLEEDERGLRYSVDLGTTTVANNVREWVKRGELRGSSFAFRDAESEWELYDDLDTTDIRTITRVGFLADVGPVTYPAYEGTSAQMNSASDGKELRALWEAEKSRRRRAAGERHRRSVLCRVAW